MKLTKILIEQTQADQLAPKINAAITSIDDSMSYVDFAQAVAKVLKDEYGTHNFEPFLQELNKQLR